MSDNEFIELDDDDDDGDLVIGDTSSETSGTSEGNCQIHNTMVIRICNIIGHKKKNDLVVRL